jgi:sulfatase modifying factor 1
MRILIFCLLLLVSKNTAPLTVLPENIAPDHLARIEGGTYTMGDGFGDGNETQHTVTLSSFYMGKTEVTFDEFDAFCAATSREKPGDTGWGRGQRPVINVDWYDAVEYCNWLSDQAKLTPAYTIDKARQDPNNQNKYDTKKYTVAVNWTADGYRLPTEAEWEYAAREGGKKVRFGNGKDIADPAQINFDASESYKKDYSVAGEYCQKAVPVNEMTGAVNSLGLRHLSGNVFEWCQDWLGANYYSESSGATDPQGPDSGENRVVRGGGWLSDPFNCRSAARLNWRPSPRNYFVGFRVVRCL